MAGWKRRRKGERVPKPLIKALRKYGLWRHFVYQYTWARMRPRRRLRPPLPNGKRRLSGWTGLGLSDRESFLYAWNKVNVRFLKGFLKEHGVEMELPEGPPPKTTEDLIWETLREAARGKTCGLKEENDWVADNAYKSPGEIHKADIPSRQAVNSLRNLLSSDTIRNEFFNKRRGAGFSKTSLDDDDGRGDDEEPMDEGSKTVLNTIEKMKKAGKPA